MKKVLISLLLGVSMVTMAGCGNADKEVVNTKVEENEREGAYPNFQDKETDEPIGLSKEEKEEKAVENANNQFATANKKYNAQQNEVEVTTLCYVHNGTIHIYNFMNYPNEGENEAMATSVAVCLDEELLTTMLETGDILVGAVGASFTINGLDINDYEVRYHDCIGNPNDEVFYELMVVDGNGNVIELLGEKAN